MTEVVQGLLTSPLFNIGTGLLAAGLDRRLNLGQAIGSGLQFGLQQQQGALQNQLFRERILEGQRQRQAQKRLTGLLSGDEIDPQQALGLLAEVAPAQVAEGLLGQVFPPQRAEPSFVRELRAAGLDPATGEGRDLLLERLRSRGATDEMLRALDLQIKAFQLTEQRRDRTEREDTRAKERRGLETSTKKALRDLQEFAQLNDNLEGTFLETGLFGTDLRRIATSVLTEALSAVGSDQSERRQRIEDFDRFKKLSADLAIDALDRMRGTGAISNQRFATLQTALADVGTSTGANRLVIADTLQAVLDGATVEGVPVDNRGEIEALIERLRGAPEVASPPEARSETPETAPRGRVLDFNELPD